MKGFSIEKGSFTSSQPTTWQFLLNPLSLFTVHEYFCLHPQMTVSPIVCWSPEDAPHRVLCHSCHPVFPSLHNAAAPMARWPSLALLHHAGLRCHAEVFCGKFPLQRMTPPHMDRCVCHTLTETAPSPSSPRPQDLTPATCSAGRTKTMPLMKRCFRTKSTELN